MSSLYDVWLQLVFGANSTKCEKLFTLFGSSEAAYRSITSGTSFPDFLTQKNIDKINSTDLSEARGILDTCRNSGIFTVSFYEKDYPSRLKSIKNRPFMLYCEGDIRILEQEFLISVVGTRHPGEYGENCAEYLSKELCKLGAVIVSGGALGIDSIAHMGALQNGAYTVCVLGCGINCSYLETNRTLREQIMQKGLVISEYPPDFKPTRYTFSDRNRIISGLSDATLVIEAGENSGALSTAAYAKKQGRKLFAVAGAMFSESFKGSNKLINEGATAVFSADDIFNAVPFRKRPLERTDIKEPSKQFLFEKPDAPKTLSANALNVYRAFEQQEISVQTLSERVDLTPTGLMVALSELEINGIITALGGGKYRFEISK